MFTCSTELISTLFHKPMAFKPLQNWPLNDHVDGSKIASISTMTNSLSCDQYDRFLKLLYQQLKIVMIWGQYDVGYNISFKLDTSDAIAVFLFGKNNKDV